LKKEHKITGIAASLQIFDSRPNDVIRAYVTAEKLPMFKKQLRLLAESKKAYHVVTEEELKTVADGSVHSEGVCLLVKSLPELPAVELLSLLEKKQKDSPSLILFLDNVENPHNLGALARVMAHFGADALLALSADTTLSLCTNPSFYRVAEGGAEATPLCEIKAGDLKSFHKKSVALGYRWVATSSHAKKGLFASVLPKRIVLMLGSESNGLSATSEELAQAHVCIEGSGKVESLNVATAAAVLIGEWTRQIKSPALMAQETPLPLTKVETEIVPKKQLISKVKIQSAIVPKQPAAGERAKAILKPRASQT
jgi:RNA methyltransferase, TrmH family